MPRPSVHLVKDSQWSHYSAVVTAMSPVSVLLVVVVLSTRMLQVAVLVVVVIQAIITPMSPVTELLVFQGTVLSIIL